MTPTRSDQILQAAALALPFDDASAPPPPGRTSVCSVSGTAAAFLHSRKEILSAAF